MYSSAGTWGTFPNFTFFFVAGKTVIKKVDNLVPALLDSYPALLTVLEHSSRIAQECRIQGLSARTL